MSKDFRDYFTGNDEEVREAFLNGYVAALRRNKVYDPALFLEGHQLEVHVIADLIAQEKRTEEARRAQARIVTEIFGCDHDRTAAEEAYLNQMANKIADEEALSGNADDLAAEIILRLPKGLEKMPDIKLPSGKTKSAIEVITSGIRSYIELAAQ